MPFGCSVSYPFDYHGIHILIDTYKVWPAIWTKGHNWPQDGEIEYELSYLPSTVSHALLLNSILEGINLQSQNQMALHTQPGCKNVSPAPTTQRGKSGQLDCAVDAGCTIVETAPASFGDAFNKAGGGVYAAQFDVTG